MGIAHVGAPHEEAEETLLEMFDNGTPTVEVLSHVALALGLMHVGTGKPEIAELLSTALLTKGFSGTLEGTYGRFLSLALGLLYLGQQDECEVVVETLSTLPENVV